MTPGNELECIENDKSDGKCHQDVDIPSPQQHFEVVKDMNPKVIASPIVSKPLDETIVSAEDDNLKALNHDSISNGNDLPKSDNQKANAVSESTVKAKVTLSKLSISEAASTECLKLPEEILHDISSKDDQIEFTIKTKATNEDNDCDYIGDKKGTNVVTNGTPRRTGRKRKLNCLSVEYLALRRLVRSGDYYALEQFLGNQSNSKELVNIRDSEGSTAINEIAGKTANFVHIAELLIKHNVDVNVGDELGHTPLHNAIIYYPATHGMVELLLNNGADVSKKNISGLTPFEMSDDTSLTAFMSENSNANTSPLNVLSNWLSTVKTKVAKICKPNHMYPKLPESPGGILKRKVKQATVGESSADRGTKRRRSSVEEQDVKSPSRKKIRFVAMESSNCEDSDVQDSSDDE